MFSNNCDFCNEFSGGYENAFTERYSIDVRDRIITATDNFRVIPSLGQISEGHLLLVPFAHYTALANLPVQLMKDVLALKERVCRALLETYGQSVFFEHGIRGTQAGGCGVEHAHLHAVPFDSAQEPINELKKNHPFKMIGSISELSQQVSPRSPYLYYEQTNGQAWVCEIDHIPSQYVRKLLAESIGVTSWDWRNCGREQALISTIARLSDVLRDNSTGNPEGIEDSHAQTDLAVAAGIG